MRRPRRGRRRLRWLACRDHAFGPSDGTLLLASHSDELLRRFCQRGLVFQEGQIVFDGPLDAALAFYHHS